MSLEERYVVIKIDDIPNALCIEETETLQFLTDKVIAYRERSGKSPLDGVFIDRRWPEYEVVCKMLQARISNQEIEEPDEPCDTW